MKERFRSFSKRVVALTGASELCWVVLASVNSTNSLARRLGQRYSGLPKKPARTVVIAWSQESGRGRGDRHWESRGGEGVWASILLPVVARDTLALLPLIAGVALAEVVQGHLRSKVRLKWPNDLYVGDAKLGGILVEGMSRGESASAVVGFGINHGLHPPEFETRTTTSMQLEPGSHPPLADFAVSLANSVDTAIDRALPSRKLMERIRKLSMHQNGDAIELTTAAGPVSGLFRSIDEQGLLVLETERGVERLAAGEIVHR